MFEQEKRELFDLCLRVKEETNAYVSVSYSTNTYMNIFIKDKGPDESSEYDGEYFLYELPDLKEVSIDIYKKAREHILRLLEKGRCPV